MKGEAIIGVLRTQEENTKGRLTRGQPSPPLTSLSEGVGPIFGLCPALLEIERTLGFALGCHCFPNWLLFLFPFQHNPIPVTVCGNSLSVISCAGILSYTRVRR